MVRPSREHVHVAQIPPEYNLRPFRQGDDAAYHELFRLAWPNEDTLPHTTKHALPGGFLVVEQIGTGCLVGSCVAFEPETPRHGDNGSLGWLVVDPEHGRRGIGTALAATVTNRLLEENYALPWLGTEDDRLAAIGIYLALGWQPNFYKQGMVERWRDIVAQLDDKSKG